jgi:hypothetical protein
MYVFVAESIKSGAVINIAVKFQLRCTRAFLWCFNSVFWNQMSQILKRFPPPPPLCALHYATANEIASGDECEDEGDAEDCAWWSEQG